MAIAKQPKSNILKEEIEGFKTLNSAIKKKKVLIPSQDNGRSIVLEDPSTYTERLNEMLDPLDVEEKVKTYVSLVKDPTKNVTRKLTEAKSAERC